MVRVTNDNSARRLVGHKPTHTATPRNDVSALSPFNTNLKFSGVFSERVVNPLPSDKFWTLPNPKSLQTTMLNLVKNAESYPKGRKDCWKKRNCSLRAVSHFPTVFSEDLYCRHVKNQGLIGKRLNLVESVIKHIGPFKVI